MLDHMSRTEQKRLLVIGVVQSALATLAVLALAGRLDATLWIVGSILGFVTQAVCGVAGGLIVSWLDVEAPALPPVAAPAVLPPAEPLECSASLVRAIHDDIAIALGPERAVLIVPGPVGRELRIETLDTKQPLGPRLVLGGQGVRIELHEVSDATPKN